MPKREPITRVHKQDYFSVPTGIRHRAIHREIEAISRILEASPAPPPNPAEPQTPGPVPSHPVDVPVG